MKKKQLTIMQIMLIIGVIEIILVIISGMLMKTYFNIQFNDFVSDELRNGMLNSRNSFTKRERFISRIL